MKELTAKDLELALRVPGVVMFDEVLVRILADQSLSATRRRDMASGLRRVAAILARELADIPADPRWLQPKLSKVSPAANGLSAKTWENAVSNMRAALAQCAIVSPRNRRGSLSPAWQALWAEVCATAKPSGSLARFIHFLDRLDVAPADVTDRHAALYHEALQQEEVHKDPHRSFRSAINAWNRAVSRIPGWPQAQLSKPAPKQIRIKRPIETYPASFAADLEAYRRDMAGSDPFGGCAEPPLRPASIAQYSRMIERFAGVLLETGVPPDQLRSLADLVDPARAEQGLRWLYKRYGGARTRGLEGMAIMLQQVGRRYVRLETVQQDRLDRFAQNLSQGREVGMTAKNRDRLRPLLGSQMTERLLDLPEQLMARAGEDRSHKACLLREHAVAIGILIFCPIRRGNLAAISVDRHIQRPGGGKAYLIFEPGEVKNHQRIEFEIPPELLRLIDRHVELRSPALCPPATPWLFPKRDGTEAMSADQLANSVTRTLNRELGMPVNLHLFRHFGVHLLLESKPGNYEAARRLLGHSSLSTTLNAYSGLESINASQMFCDIIREKRQ